MSDVPRRSESRLLPHLQLNAATAVEDQSGTRDAGQKKLRTLGLLGGVGTGKSTVARLLAESGACVLDADRAAAEVLAETPTIRAILERFGPKVIDASGRVDRGALAARVFGGNGVEGRSFLENLLHPRVRERLARELDAIRASPPSSGLAVLDVPLLIEGPLSKWCDLLVFIETPDAERVQRCVRDRGWAGDEVPRREAAQAPLAEKRARADFVVVNDGDLQTLRTRVQDLLAAIAGSPPPVNRRIKNGAAGS